MDNFVLILTKPDNVPIIGMIFLLAYYNWLAFSKAKANDAREIPIEAEMTDKVHVWPYLVRQEFLMSILVLVILTVWSILIDAPLEEAANPSVTPNPSKAPWYFLGLQEMLVYFDPWIAGVMLPTLIIIGMMAMPYIDINPKGNGYYTIKERKFAIYTFVFGFAIWIALIIVGTFLRGPGWNFFLPWQYWDPHKVVAANNVDFTELFGIHTRNIDNTLNVIAVLIGGILVIGYLVALPIWYWYKNKDKEIFKELGPVRYGVTAFLFVAMMGLPIKMMLRWFLNVKYVWVTSWFNV